MPASITSEDRPFLSAVLVDLNDDRPKLIYADWLEERGDPRGAFVRQFVTATATMQASDFPATDGLPEEWLDLMGFQLVKEIADRGFLSLKEPVLRLARPALRMDRRRLPPGTILPTDRIDDLPLYASKIGGLPDLPEGFAWPTGNDCHPVNDHRCAGIEQLAGFLAQVNLAEIAQTQAGQLLPKAGLLSFFCYHDGEIGDPSVIGARCVYFPDVSKLFRRSPPDELAGSNESLDPQRLSFAEYLDIPHPIGGPWSGELAQADGDSYRSIYISRFSHSCIENLLGYLHTFGNDPTPSQQSLHLVSLDTALFCMLHVQISEQELAARDFSTITMNWKDFGF